MGSDNIVVESLIPLDKEADEVTVEKEVAIAKLLTTEKDLAIKEATIENVVAIEKETAVEKESGLEEDATPKEKYDEAIVGEVLDRIIEKQIDDDEVQPIEPGNDVQQGGFFIDGEDVTMTVEINSNPVMIDESPQNESQENNQTAKNIVENQEEDEREYVVEKILDKKIDSKGFAKYLVKWEGFPPSENSWEPLEHLAECDKIMQNYETSRAMKLATKIRDKNGTTTVNNNRQRRPSKHRRYEVGDVMGLTEANNERYYLISLANSTQKTFIRSSLANKLFPGKVIDFYLKNLRWKEKPQQ